VTHSKPRATSFTLEVTQPIRFVQMMQAIGVLPHDAMEECGAAEQLRDIRQRFEYGPRRTAS